jgi:hypothetical protein
MTRLTNNTAIERTRNWVREAIIGLNLCPFAEEVFAKGSIRYAACEGDKLDSCFQYALMELDTLQQTPEEELATSLVIFSDSLTDFAKYLDFYGNFCEAIEESGLSGVMQAVPFHPDYLHQGVPGQSLSHYTNRSPYPMIHLLREAQVARLSRAGGSSETITANNSKCLEKLGLDEIQRIWSGHSGDS